MFKILSSIPIVKTFFGFAKDQITEIGEDKNVEIINQTIQAELKTESMFVKCWRPFFGYCVSVAWVAYMAIICYIVLSNKPNSIDLILAMAETTSLWSMALGVLGISVVKRSSDKRLFNIFNTDKSKNKGE
ncbi:MAG: 3TM-type holin [Alphaproteobacteria bacterium]